MLSDVFTTEEMNALAFAGLNAPFGARCFLTQGEGDADDYDADIVLMHLLALGAF